MRVLFWSFLVFPRFLPSFGFFADYVEEFLDDVDTREILTPEYVHYEHVVATIRFFVDGMKIGEDIFVEGTLYAESDAYGFVLSNASYAKAVVHVFNDHVDYPYIVVALLSLVDFFSIEKQIVIKFDSISSFKASDLFLIDASCEEIPLPGLPDSYVINVDIFRENSHLHSYIEDILFK